jgi:hypothetical protein
MSACWIQNNTAAPGSNPDRRFLGRFPIRLFGRRLPDRRFSRLVGWLFDRRLRRRGQGLRGGSRFLDRRLPGLVGWFFYRRLILK